MGTDGIKKSGKLQAGASRDMDQSAYGETIND
jgi:hypothetical protein